MAPFFIVDVTKEHGATLQQWGNRYIIQADDLTAAASAVSIIVPYEKDFHFNGVNFLQARVSTLVPDDGLYVTVPLTGTGTKAVTGKTMPLFCCMRADFLTLGFGRPSRKYYHTGFDDVFYDADFTFDDTYLSDTFGDLEAMIADLSANATDWVDPQGDPITAPIIKTRVTHHQFKKASRRVSP